MEVIIKNSSSNNQLQKKLNSNSNTSRREFGKLAIAGTLGGASLLTSSHIKTYANTATTSFAQLSSKPGIKLALMGSSSPNASLQLAGLQMGVTHVIAGANLRGGSVEQYAQYLGQMKESYEKQGLTIAGFEGPPVNHERIKLGSDGRDEDIEDFNKSIQAMSQVGLDMICYNWMVGLGWTRTSQSVPYRGGALTSEFNLEAMNQQRQRRMGFSRGEPIGQEQVWANLEYFLQRVIPVADKYQVKMALHPDDPPLSPLGGYGRIVINADNYRRIMDMVPSPMNGITFCQANFKLMGEDIYSLAAQWCREKKIFLVHFRDVEGKKEKFHETFHDNGPTDMGRMLKIYHESGFDGPIRPDHAPSMGSETSSGRSSGYGVVGKIFAIAYMKGLMDGQGIPYV